MKFAEASSVTRNGDGSFSCHLEEDWSVVGKTNGGYMVAIAARAVTEHTGRPDALTTTAHFVTPGEGGEASVHVDTVRDGKRSSTANFRLTIGDRTIIAGIATATDLAAASGVEELHGSPPDLPPVEECIKVLPSNPFPPPLMDHVDIRLHPEDGAFFIQGPSGRARMRGWVRLPEDQPIDSISVRHST